jgi:hypothetical protein
MRSLSSAWERHYRTAKPQTTAVYMHRVNAAQIAAQEKFLEAIKVNSMAN